MEPIREAEMVKHSCWRQSTVPAFRRSYPQITQISHPYSGEYVPAPGLSAG